LLTVILPQSLKKQPPESQELLSKVRILVICITSHFPHIMDSAMSDNLHLLLHI
jgi:hypothetical protein